MHIHAMRELGVDIYEECKSLEQKDINDIPNAYPCGTLSTLNPHNSFGGDRPWEKGFEKSTLTDAAFIKAFIKNKPAKVSVTLQFPSVGATENVLLCSAFSEIEVQLNNAAREPEIIALQDFLNSLGAKIKGAGTSRLIIEPCSIKERSKTTHHFETPSDRIECGTYLIAGAICCGTLTFQTEDLKYQKALLQILKNASLIGKDKNSTIVKFNKRPSVSDLIVTTPFPGTPTDLQSQLSAFFCTVKGKNYIVEHIFKNRTAHLDELKKMGAKIIRKNNCFIIEGQTSLHGSKVISKDLRGGAALILAGLGASGTTEVLDNSYISRGYTKIEKKLSNLGADITKLLV